MAQLTYNFVHYAVNMTCLTILGVFVLLYITWKLVDKYLRQGRISNLSDRYIFITGCDTGFGNATAKRLDKLGCHVFAACLTATGEENVKQDSSERLLTVRLDVADSHSIKKAYEYVSSKLPKGRGLWGLINNAGVVGQIGLTEWLTAEDYHKCLNVNTFGMIDMTITFLPLIRKENGRVVNMASAAGRLAVPWMGPYCVSKYAVEAFSDSLRREVANIGIGVHIIEPGSFRTSIGERLVQNIETAWQRAPIHVKIDYDDAYIEQVKDTFKKSLMTSANPDLSEVVDAYEHAVLGKHPRYRYLVGQVFLVPIFQAMPEYLTDTLLNFMFPKAK